jgi:hypothetical protein
VLAGGLQETLRLPQGLVRARQESVCPQPHPPTDHKEITVMHVQIVEFELQGVNRADHERRSEQLAETFAGLPGLLAKV